MLGLAADGLSIHGDCRPLRTPARRNALGALLALASVLLALATSNAGCGPGNTTDDYPPDPCPYRARLAFPCVPGTPDRWWTPPGSDAGSDPRPESCVAEMGQHVGLGRCESDSDCALWTGTALVPAEAEPPYSRCIEFETLGERFCEAFTQVASDPWMECRSGYPCYPQYWAPWEDPYQYVCVQQSTRDGSDGSPGAWITACVEGRPEPYLDPRCERVW
jgi:hypothetical protein